MNMAKVSIQKRSLAEYLEQVVNSHLNAKPTPKKPIFSIEFANGKADLCMILEIGSDYIEVKDSDSRIFSVPLTSGMTKIRDVTGLKDFVYKGDK